MDSTTLDDHRWQRMRQLFLDISPLDAAAREARLGGEDESVAAAVRRLLALHDEMTGSGTGDPAPPPIAAALAAAYDRSLQQTGVTIAQFRLERLLGEGGMGRVYLARREIGGSVQRVALKIVPLAIRTPRLIEQLRRERAILAGLDHPHIARLIDAGELPDGHPYFAMEYVAGIPLLRYCDDAGLDLRARLRLFLDVCEAVAYAHRQLVLHRDLKSSNILVDADGRLRLLDFGIAKSLEDVQGRDATSDNFFSLRAASPEQVLGKPSTISTDVYGLGCLLYELLTGRPPFRLDEGTREDTIRRIAHEPPPLASAAVAGDADDAVATQRGLAGAPALAAALRGDLDTVLAKALRKDPAERYRSVDEFAAELSNVLEFRPISARASERWYRLRMLLRRHRATAAVAAVLSFAVLATTAISVLQYFRAEAERKRAVEALASAQLQRDHAQHVSDFLVDAFGAADPERGRVTDMPAGQLIEQAAANLEKKSNGLDPTVHAQLAQTLSWLFYRLDRADDAVRQAQVAKDTIARITRPSVELLVRQDLVEGTAATLQNRYAAAGEFANRGLNRMESLTGFANSDLLLQLLELRARASYETGNNLVAIQNVDMAFSILRLRPDVPVERWDGLRRLRAQALTASGDFRAALTAAQSLVDDQRAGGRTNDSNHVATLHLLGQTFGRLNEYRQAMASYEEALKKNSEIHGDEIDQRTLQLYGSIASLYVKTERLLEAAQLFRRMIDLSRQRYGGKHSFLGKVYFYAADCYYDLGDMKVAEFYFRRALDAAPDESAGSRAIYRRHLGMHLMIEGKLFESAYELERANREMHENYAHGFQIDALDVNLSELSVQRFDMSRASAQLSGNLLQRVRENFADRDTLQQAERLSAYFGWNRADGTTIVPPLSR